MDKNITFRLSILTVLSLFCFSCSSTFVKIYCVKSDPSSVRLIPKKDPYKPICDSITFVNNLVIGKLNSIEAQISNEYRKMYNEKIQELSNKTYFELDYLRRCYELYISRPCDEQAYKDYIYNLAQIRETLLKVESLKSDINVITGGGSITGNSETGLIDRISIYLNENK
jgi:hypothetical protein